MNAKELSIGCWVSTPKGNGQVCGIDCTCLPDYHSVEVFVPGYDGIEPFPRFNLDEIKPIPITQEILERNGFVLTGVGDEGVSTPRAHRNRYEKHVCKTQWRDIVVWYDRTTKKWALHGMNQVPLAYVHHIQQALRLCGIDKEIEL